VKAAALPAGEALAATHVGPYANLNQSHKALWGHAEKPGLEKATPVWEIYVDDPGDT
jgi:effector-binding domain-containing protein